MLCRSRRAAQQWRDGEQQQKKGSKAEKLGASLEQQGVPARLEKKSYLIHPHCSAEAQGTRELGNFNGPRRGEMHELRERTWLRRSRGTWLIRKYNGLQSLDAFWLYCSDHRSYSTALSCGQNIWSEVQRGQRSHSSP